MAAITEEQRAALLALYGCYETYDASSQGWIINLINTHQLVVIWSWTEELEFYVNNLPDYISRADEYLSQD